MPFECPDCNEKSLQITFGLELPPGAEDDEIALQVVKCAGYRFLGLAVCRESRRGPLDSESWYHDGYQVSDESLEPLLEALLLCPSPRDRNCECSTHISLEKYNWTAIEQNGIAVKKRFKMHFVG